MIIWYFCALIVALLVVKFVNERKKYDDDNSLHGLENIKSDDGGDKPRYLPYKTKGTIMSSHERLLFENLRLVLNPKYDVYPQAHLDNIFSVEYQRSYNYYLGYLRKINQKSVDFLIVDRQTQSPAFAIELDDITHELDDRRERDNFVQAVFDKAGLNLIRFNSGQYGAEVLKTVLQKYLI